MFGKYITLTLEKQSHKLQPASSCDSASGIAENRGVKRGADEDMEVEEAVQQKQESEPCSQRTKVDKEDTTNQSTLVDTKATSGLNLPVPDSNGQACILKVRIKILK